MSAQKTPRCRECHQEVRWATTTNGKKIPLIPSPDPEGTYVDLGGGRVQHLREWQIARAEAEQVPLWAHHRTACLAEKTSTACPPHLRARLGLSRKDQK